MLVSGTSFTAARDGQMDANDELAQACAEVVSTRSEEESLKRRSEIIFPQPSTYCAEVRSFR